jgi:hypothetical protein
MNRRGIIVLTGVGCIIGVIAWQWPSPSSPRVESGRPPPTMNEAVSAPGGSGPLNSREEKSKSNPGGKAPETRAEVKKGSAQQAPTPLASTGNAVTAPGKQMASGAATNQVEAIPRGSASIQQGSQFAPRALVERNTALFFAAVKVDDETRQRLIQVEVDHSLEFQDITELSRAQGLSDAEINKLRDEAFKKYREKIAEVLGPEQGNYFITLENSAMFGPIAENFADRCAAQGEALTPAAMAAIRINLAENLRSPRINTPPRTFESIQNQAFNSAAKVLTAGQLEVFKQLWSERPFPKPGDMPSR